MLSKTKNAVWGFYSRLRLAAAVFDVPTAKSASASQLTDKRTTYNSSRLRRIDSQPIDTKGVIYRYNNGALMNNSVYCIPTGATQILEISCRDDKIDFDYFGSLPTGEYKWSGACEYCGKIYGFPRCANTLLEIDTSKREAKEIDLGLNYSKEHHYGGVLKNNVIYQPPRNSALLQKIDLDTMRADVVKLPRGLSAFRFSSSVLHSSGNIYFISSIYGKVFMYSPQNDELFKLRGTVSATVYNAVEAPDGNIYAFSGQEDKGILMIDTGAQCVKQIHTEITPGACGTLIAGNGKLYSVLGRGNAVYEFEPRTNTLSCVGKVEDEGDTKCAGAVLLPCGDIVCIPAKGNKTYVYRFSD